MPALALVLTFLAMVAALVAEIVPEQRRAPRADAIANAMVLWHEQAMAIAAQQHGQATGDIPPDQIQANGLVGVCTFALDGSCPFHSYEQGMVVTTWFTGNVLDVTQPGLREALADQLHRPPDVGVAIAGGSVFSSIDAIQTAPMPVQVPDNTSVLQSTLKPAS